MTEFALEFDTSANAFDTEFKEVQVVNEGEGGGVSPIAYVEQLENGAKIVITDQSGTTTATVYNGSDGVDGVDGKDGADGYSPQEGVDYYNILTHKFTEKEKETVCDNIGATSKEDFHYHILDYTRDYDYFANEITALKEANGDIDAALDVILAMQNNLIGGEA